MVLLTMTPAIVSALSVLPPAAPNLDDTAEVDEACQSSSSSVLEPSLANPSIGNPISHAQILDLHTSFGGKSDQIPSLEELLRGTKVYVPPPPPKPAKSKEYLELMARLRREEEARAYERMINPPAPITTVKPSSSPYSSYTEANRALPRDLGEDTSILHEDVHRQLTLLLNFLVSIIGVAGTLWVAARWWHTPARLFLTMGGSIVVGVAEVIVYQLWVWKMGEAKKGQVKMKEKREVVKTWIVGKDGENEEDLVLVGEENGDSNVLLRRRRVGETEEAQGGEK